MADIADYIKLAWAERMWKWGLGRGSLPVRNCRQMENSGHAFMFAQRGDAVVATPRSATVRSSNPFYAEAGTFVMVAMNVSIASFVSAWPEIAPSIFWAAKLCATLWIITSAAAAGMGNVRPCSRT